MNPTYVPDVERPFEYGFRYLKSEEDETPVYGTNVPYTDSDVYAGGPAELDKKINEALVERFGQGVMDGDTIGTDNTAKIWYICRFLDGFIIETNIDEVKEIIYGEVESEGSVVSYSPESDKDDRRLHGIIQSPNCVTDSGLPWLPRRVSRMAHRDGPVHQRLRRPRHRITTITITTTTIIIITVITAITIMIIITTTTTTTIITTITTIRATIRPQRRL